ncbi:MAG: Ppx/GppA phosphatase family protein, partial [Pyrinomonadaceae bacterium]
AVERAAACIKRFRSIAEARGAERIVAIATASVREADNAAEFIGEMWRQTGVRVEILSGVEEARLIGLAASRGCAARDATLLNLDIGGGSTEISLMREGVPLALFSVKLGAVGLTERFIASDPPKQKELRALREEIHAVLERPARELRGARWRLVTGTSGTILAVGEAMESDSSAGTDIQTQSAQPAGKEIALVQLENFNARLAAMSVSERKSLSGISAQRAEIAVAGGQILEGVMRALNIKALRTCEWALREGVIIDRLRELEAELSPPAPDVIDARLLGVHAVGRRFGYEEAHANQVARLAGKIFDNLARAYGLTRHQRTLLSAAALLHDVGYHIAHESHHKHSLYLIKHSELTGFSETERAVIANVARYHRGPAPKERHAEYAALGQPDRETVCRLSAILRIADALDRSYDARVRNVRLTRSGEVVNIGLFSELDCDKEITAALQKSEMFAQVFNCAVTFNTRAPQDAVPVRATRT